MPRRIPSAAQLAAANQVLNRLVTNGTAAQQAGDRVALSTAIRASEFSDQKRTVDLWLKGDPGLRQRVLAATFPAPPHANPALLTLATDLDSAEWHCVKHRQHVNDQWVLSATLHDYFDDLLNCMTSPAARVFVGHDPKALMALRVGLLVRLGGYGHPCTRLSPALHTVPGVHMFIAWNPREPVIVTGFPIQRLSLANPYPRWQNQIEVTL